MNKTALEVAHHIARNLHQFGAIDARTMREFDIDFLPKIKVFTPNQLKKLRLKNNVSQAVFAAYLNTTSSTVKQWEQGLKKPSGLALKLLNLVDRYGLALLVA